MDPININYAILALSAVIVLLLVMIPMCNTGESYFSSSAGSRWGQYNSRRKSGRGGVVGGSIIVPNRPGRAGNVKGADTANPPPIIVDGPIIVAAPGSGSGGTLIIPPTGNLVNTPFTGPIMTPISPFRPGAIEDVRAQPYFVM